MTDQIYKIEVIAELPFPGEIQDTQGQAGKSSGDETYTPDSIPALNFPTQTIARDVISDNFNSQSKRILGEFTFNESGAIAVGKYVSGVSGDVRISPNGIVARNSSGVTTFSLDATTGDATFLGTIAANSLIAGRTNIGSGGNIYIDGSTPKIVMSDGTYDKLYIGYVA